MKKQTAAVTAMAVGATIVGFMIGFGVGKKTREATPSNVKTQYNSGVVTITADVGNALKQGALDFFTGK